MTHRDRYISCLTFGTPDKIPFEPGHPRESTLKVWHGQGLPEGAPYFDFLIESLGMDYGFPKNRWMNLGVDFRLRPRFEEKVIERRPGTLVVQDWKGNVCEISDEFDVTYLRQARDFVTRRWLKCPVENRGDWEKMKQRYDPADPARFPAGYRERCQAYAGRDNLLTVAVNGPFWQMREWCGFEGLCFLMHDDPALVAEMARFWEDFVSKMLERILGDIVFDRLLIQEDMAYKAKSMISPEMTREYCQPSWKHWAAQSAKAGVPIIELDSDGYIEDLIPLWIESGLNACSPMEVAAHNDLPRCRERHGKSMAWRMGVDKRAIAKGGTAIQTEMQRLEPVIRSGGYIPGCDHGVPSDVSWAAFTEYSRLLAQMTGWL